MVLAVGIAKTVRFSKESTWNTSPGAGTATLLRRVNSTLDMNRDAFQSNEIRPSQQISDMRLGLKRVTGSLDGELSPGTYSLFMGTMLRGAFTAGVSTGALTNVTAAVGPPGTFTRAAGSFLTDGFKIGDIVNWTGWATTGTGNNSRNYRITALTALVMTVGTAATGAAGQPEVVGAKASGDSVTCSVVGKKSMTPQSSQLDESYSIEHWYSDIAQSELFTGCKPASMAINLPNSGIATARFSWLGGGMVGNTSQYFTSPSAASTNTALAGINGTLRFNGADIAIVTGSNFTVTGNHSVEAVIGSTTTPAVFYGKVMCTGQFTAFFQDNVNRDLFLNETETSLNIVLTANTTINSSFINFNFPRIKLSSSTKADNEKGLIQSFGFTALENINGGTGISTDSGTVIIQDSLA